MKAICIQNNRIIDESPNLAAGPEDFGLPADRADCVFVVPSNTPIVEAVETEHLMTLSDGSVGKMIEDRPVTGNPFLSLPETKAFDCIRARRDALLAATVDTLNPIRWDSMSQADKDKWIAYRLALLDVPQQAGAPFDVAWPVVG